jgi:hypothetical protein
MSQSRTKSKDRDHNPEHDARRPKPTVVLDVCAAYNRDNLAMPKPNGPNGRRVLSMEMLLEHPFYWDWLNERETEEVLMELYVARTRRMQ